MRKIIGDLVRLRRHWRTSGLRKRDLAIIVAMVLLGFRPVGGPVRR